MRRTVSLLFLFTFVLISTAVFQETTGLQTAVYSQPLPPNATRLDLVPIEGFGPTAVNDLETGNSCTDSVNVPVSETGGGGTVYVNELETDAGDPDISSCSWGTADTLQGSRSAWYQFTTEYAGNATISTNGTNYDTIISVFDGSCGALQTVSCNDDYEGFASEITFDVTANTTYFLEVVDWQSGWTELPLLYIAAWLNPIESRWETMNSLPSQLSRHSTAVVDTDIYVLGGQTSIGTTSTALYRLDTTTGNWTTLTNSSMPRNGLTNSTAAHVDGNIYLPGGQDGLGAISDVHRVYDIDSDLWSTATTIAGTPFAWSQAVSIDNGYYVTGGSDYTGNTLPPAATNPPTSTITVSDRLLFYRASFDAWETKPSMQAPRFAHVADLVNGEICVAGGLQMSGGGVPTLVTSGECYNSNNSTWSYTSVMNEPRFAAASAVGLDGKWYVFGGLTVDDGTVVAAVSTEVYDPATNQWRILPPAHDLGRLDSHLDYVLPHREWAVGGAVGEYIWAIGGNIPVNDSTVPLAERLRTYEQYDILTYLPVVLTPSDNSNFSTMATAQPIYLNSPRWDAFSESQFYHAYVFDVYSTGVTIINMSDIAEGNDYDLFLYDDNKGLRASSINPGNSDENIQRNLAAGRYYVMVKRTFQINANESYRLIVQR